MRDKIWPNIFILKRDDEIQFETIVRKELNGKYYMASILEAFVGDVENNYNEWLNVFLKSVYKYILMGVPQPELRTYTDGEIFLEDKYWGGLTEKERMLL